jgi:copper oxidase (laccase) domain-containing protein
LQLEATGIKAENIEESGICTYDEVEDYFSARRLGIASGRILTGIVLK